MLNKIRNVSFLGISPFKNFWGYSPLSVPVIPQLKDGGTLNMGQMFIAREAGAELVGGFGNKTGVMNNDDIVHSVSKGVYDAVRSAMSGQGGDSSPQRIVVNVMGDTLVDRTISATNRKSLIDGKTVINV